MGETLLKSTVPMFGGKRGLAPAIVQQLGPHRYFFEPFCGSLAVLFAKPRSSHEVVCDLHRDLANLALVLRDLRTAVPVYERLQRTICCEAIYLESGRRLAGAQAEDPERFARPKRAYDFFVVSWMGMNGVTGSTRATADLSMATRWTPNGGASAVRFRSATESIPWWHERLRNVQVLCRDAFDVLPRVSDEAGVSIYADPPYPPETLTGDSRYQHDFTSHGGALFAGGADDHQRLAEELRRFRQARVVVSCYECDRYRELYDGWTFIEHTRRKNLHNQGGRGGHGRPKRSVAPEVLIVNGEAL